jgi:hypothetical protein
LISPIVFNVEATEPRALITVCTNQQSVSYYSGSQFKTSPRSAGTGHKPERRRRPPCSAWAVHGLCGVNSRSIISLFLFTMGREKRGLRLTMSKGFASEVSARIDRVYATPICSGNIFELSILSG